MTPEMFNSLVEINTDSKIREVLFLAGDICEWHAKEHFSKFFKWASKNFMEVVYVYGNHEFYKLNYFEVKRAIQEELDKYSNVTILDLEHNRGAGFMHLNGVRIIGSTLWTDFNKGNPLVMLGAMNGMADYYTIYKTGYFDNINPEFILQENQKTVERIEYLVKDSHLPVVLMTHHAPFEESRDTKYPLDSLSYAFFNTGLYDLAEKYSNKIRYWFHGHIHSSVDYMVGDTRVIANPAGYPNRAGIRNENPVFDPRFIIEYK
jgi:hypothetical protein